ncbi:hypothetical protein KV097_10490 [Mumia sp. zg.B17]|uniref:hypothetical protein n=1 Tax=Mumia sp. zg.B17 TaxID=2855446 RepID=UPI001C6F5591|nr:hypothetical protein [Mumia sp. zg.B17]MBW9206373.1 hypothetical protein [Mumia sp. zg.B17]
MRRAVHRIERRRGAVLVAVLALTTAFRLPYLWAPLSSDEGGFLLVAHQWGTTDGSLYGNQWVDRPPGLILLFGFADLLSGPLGDRVALRLVALVLALVAVAAAWYAGRAVGGTRGALAAALVMCAVTSTPAFSGPRMATVFPAVVFAAVTVALALAAAYEVTSPRVRAALAAGAGVTGVVAVLMKQNVVDGLVFAAVLWAMSGRRGWKLAAAGAAGASLPLLATLVWAVTGPGLGGLWEAMYGFREQAAEVIISSSSVAPELRMRLFVLALVGTGAFLLGVLTVWGAVRERRRPVAVATLAVLACAVVGIVGGGSWWRHYALQLALPLALGAALAVRSGLLRTTRVAVALALVATFVAVAWRTPAALEGRPTSGTAVGEWIGERTEPGDAGLVAYGSPQVLRVAGLFAPYPYSWSLPVRVLDPDLDEMTALLAGPEAPEWLVEMGSFTWWGIDTDAFNRVVATRYREVADVCGHRVYLRSDVERDVGSGTSWCPALYGRTTPGS